MFLCENISTLGFVHASVLWVVARVLLRRSLGVTESYCGPYEGFIYATSIKITCLVDFSFFDQIYFEIGSNINILFYEHANLK